MILGLATGSCSWLEFVSLSSVCMLQCEFPEERTLVIGEMKKWRLIVGSVFIMAVIATGALAWFCIFKPLWLTQVYGSDLSEAVAHYAELRSSLSTCLNPAQLAEVAVGAELADRQSALDNRHICYVKEQPRVRVARVLEYSPTCAKLTVEHWYLRQYQFDLDALEVITDTDPVNATPELADKFIYILVRDNSDADWKVAYRKFLSEYMRTHEWFEIPNCNNVPTAYPTDK
jgi:hypothetical protein